MENIYNDILKSDDKYLFSIFEIVKTELRSHIFKNFQILLESDSQYQQILNSEKEYFLKKANKINMNITNSDSCLSFDDMFDIFIFSCKKKCLTCDQLKYYYMYCIDSSKTDGYKSSCKDCCRTSKNLVTLKNLKCSSDFCEEKGFVKYDKYCKHCFMNLFPTDNRCNNYRTKEKMVSMFLISIYKDMIRSANQIIKDGTSRYRPDIHIDCNTHHIIVEVDENQHKSEQYNLCENKRMCQILSDLDNKSTIFIRFNPDKYSLINGNIVDSCFKKSKTGIIQLENKKDWENRLSKLKDTIDLNIKNVPNKMITVIHLFYDD